MDQDLTRHLVNCTYYLRTPAAGHDGQTGYRYDFVDTSRFHNTLTQILTLHPPQVGDLIHFDEGYRVVERSWSYSRYGSTNWPGGEPMQTVGPDLTLIVERFDGPFVNEIPTPDAGDDA